jgi:hypothetical protein
MGATRRRKRSRRRAVRRPKARWIVVAVVALSCVAMVLSAAGPGYRADPLSIEGEGMGGAVVFSNKTASGHKAARLYQAGSVSESFEGSIGGVTVRARGVACEGPPKMVVSVDGRTIASRMVRAERWEDYHVHATVPSGTHVLQIAFVNDHHNPPACDRNLHLDKIAIAPGSETPTAVRIPKDQKERGVPDLAYRAPTLITEGGTYSGDWVSLDSDVPALQIETVEPVVIENSTLAGRGELIKAVGPTDIAVRDSRGYGLNPNEEGRAPGRFLSAVGFVNVELENNYMAGTAGVYLHNYSGDGTLAQTIKVLRNEVENIEGRHSDGAGGFSRTGFHRVQFLQLNNVKNITGVDIGWNQVVNRPGESRVEDNINVYLSRGTPESPILIHDNYIQGAYPALPDAEDYSGGGIITDGKTCDPAAATAFVEISENQVVGTSNYGIALYGGHDNSVHDNRVVSSGQLADGSYVGSQNVGIYVADLTGARVCGAWYNNSAYNNEVGWVNGEPQYAHSGYRNDMWFPVDGGAYAQNHSLPSPIVRSTEAEEFARWQTKTAAANVAVGPRD